MILNARKGDFADDEKFKCYFKCLFDQMGCVSFAFYFSDRSVLSLVRSYHKL